MAQADAKEGLLRCELSDVLTDSANSLGVTRTVRQEDGVGREGERLGRGGRRGNHRHIETLLDQQSKNIALDSEVVGDEPEATARTGGPGHLALDPRPAAVAPLVGLLAGHLGDEITTVETGRAPGAIDQVRLVLVLRIGAENAHLGASLANASHQRAGVDTCNSRHARVAQPGVETTRCPPAARDPKEFLDHESRQKGAIRLFILRVHPDVSDLCIGHGDDLTGIGWIGQDLLIARHARVEDDLAFAQGVGSEGEATKHPPVGERQTCWSKKTAGQVHPMSTPRSEW